MRCPHAVGLGFSVLVVLAGSALGQEAPARDEKRPPLQGPAVKENRAPHVQDQFSESMKAGRMGVQIPMRAYSDVIGKLRGDKAPEGLRLSDEQEQKLGAIEQEYREAARAFAQEQREQRGEGQPRRPRAQDGDGAQPRREMAQEMMRSGPRPSDYQTRVWAMLNEPQQAFVKVELDKVRDDMQKRRSEEMMQRRIDQQKGDQRKDAKPGEPGEPRRPAAVDPDQRPLRERGMKLMRRIASMPEAERDQLLSRIEAELDRRGVPEAPEGERPQPK